MFLGQLDSMSISQKILKYMTPRYIGINGNGKTDSAAESPVDMAPDLIKIPYTD